MNRLSVRLSHAFLLSTSMLLAIAIHPQASMAETCMTEDLLMVYEPVDTPHKKTAVSTAKNRKNTVASKTAKSKSQLHLDKEQSVPSAPIMDVSGTQISHAHSVTGR